MGRMLFGNTADATGGGRRPSPAWLAPLLVLALWAADAKAQTVALVGNVGQSGTEGVSLGVWDLAQKFTTGTNSAGYDLTSVEVHLFTNANLGTDTAAPRVRVVRGAATGTGSEPVATLTAATTTLPATARANYTYTAPTPPQGIVLRASTDYWVVVEAASSGGGDVHFFNTNSNAEDGTPAAGWSIDDSGLQRAHDSTGGFGAEDRAYMIRVNGSVRTNVPATGKPTITGVATVGRLLQASRGTITDTEGLPAAFDYQWIRVDGATETDIQGADSSTYRLVDADEGKTVKVRMSFTDLRGGMESRTSDAFPSSGTVQAAPVIVGGLHVTNLGQARGGADTFDRFDAAQKFTTGTNAGGYTLSSVDLRLEVASPNVSHPAVKVVKGAPAGEDSEDVATLTPRSRNLIAHAANFASFGAPPGIRLDPSTDYWVVVERSGGDAIHLALSVTASDAEDGSSAADWSIADTALWRAADSTGAFERRVRGVSYMIRVDAVAGAAAGAPTAADGSVRTRPDTAYAFRVDDFGYSDPDGDALASVKIETLPASGKGALTLDGNAVAAGQDVARGDIEAGDLQYAPPAGEAGEDFASFTFRVNDGTADSANAATMTVHVSTVQVENAPPVAADGSVRTRPDTGYAFRVGDFGYSDPDGDALASVKIETLPASGRGTLTLDGSAVTAGQAVARSDIELGRLEYAPPAGAAGENLASFTFRVSDGTADSANAYTMTVHVSTVRVENAPPVAADGSVRIGADAEYAFRTGDFGYSDADGDALANVKIETLPASGRGTLTLGGSAVAAGQAVARSDIEAGNLRYAPPAGAAGEDFASFTFRVSDGTVDSADAYTMTVHVGNRAPVAADGSVRIGADTEYAFKVGDFGYSDADGDALAGIAIRTLAGLPAGSALRLDGAPVRPGQAVTRAQLEAGGLVFVPEAGGTGSPYATFSFTVSDGFADSAPATMRVHVVGPGGERAVGAWVSRFGRTVADQVVAAVEGRMRAARRPQAEVSLAGGRIGLLPPPGDARAPDPGAEPARAGATRTMSGGELLLGSSFALTGAAADGGSAAFWGGAAVTRFDGREDGLAVDGEVTGAMLGADWQRGSWTTGLVVAHSQGEGGYREGGGGAARGSVEATLTGLYPWLRLAPDDRLEAWGAAGYGAGGLRLVPDGGAATRTDLAAWMAAAGLRGALLDPGGAGLRLTARTDALFAGASTDAAGSGAGRLAAVEARVARLRLGLEGALPMRLGPGSALTPGFELGARHDGGDAETGLGADIGASLAWTDAGRGLSMELSGRGLLSHKAKGFRERGVSAVLLWQPGTDARGPRLSLAQSLGGASAGGAAALLGRTTPATLANPGGGELKRRRLEARLGYGFAAFGSRFTLTPEAGFGLSQAARDYRIGWRLARRPGPGPGSAELSLDARRRESAAAPPVHEGRVRLTARF